MGRLTEPPPGGRGVGKSAIGRFGFFAMLGFGFFTAVLRSAGLRGGLPMGGLLGTTGRPNGARVSLEAFLTLLTLSFILAAEEAFFTLLTSRFMLPFFAAGFLAYIAMVIVRQR